MPLDYAHPEIGSATLSLARLQSSRAPRLGAVFSNLGGPGESGVEQVKALGSAFNAFTKGQYNVVDGIHVASIKLRLHLHVAFALLMSCRHSSTVPLSMMALKLGTSLGSRIWIVSFESDRLYNKRFWTKMFGWQWGTTAVVRDIVTMMDCLDSPSSPIIILELVMGVSLDLLVFPKCVGRVVINGIADAIGWATEPSYQDSPSCVFKPGQQIVHYYRGSNERVPAEGLAH
ncbi:hypothetical protein M422DRAFT_256243 [Sphaerobolus stellatus SS14]|uniref:Uncharacterized protein n=1 Tax=Sphaerobolus stellatus (strain SS14) TaxID=990650 RepID=A0A0C9VR65_SPHS4|nr:hypothetical protein M422DRAFT_256243 [Sphaerobolus stellatus SS14]